MKIRSGFVSNSSSSSFCILGVDLTGLDEPKEWKNPKVAQHITGIADYYELELIGANPSKMLDDETLREFKQRVLDDINQLGYSKKFTLKDLDWWIDGGYNG